MKVIEGRLWLPGRGLVDGCVGIGDDGRIAAVRKVLRGDEHIRVRGMVLPAALDMHVHFREPGLTHKEDWTSGSAAAACGGVTAVVEMPNTRPPTDSPAALREKAALAARGSLVDFGLAVAVQRGSVREPWFGDLPVAAWKLYPYGMTWDDFRATAAEVVAARRRPLVVHAEHPGRLGDAPLRELADHTRNRADAEAACLPGLPASPWLHVAHLSSEAGLRALPVHATAEVTPHHLLLNLDAGLGLAGKVDPPLRTRADNAALWAAFRAGRPAILASDHAPHLPEEKGSDAPPSGLPGVETMVPLMLHHVATGKLELGRLVNAMAEAPANRLGLERGRITVGQPADLLAVDLRAGRRIRADALHSRAGWTPYDDREAVFPQRVWRRGTLVAADSEPQVRGGGESLFSPLFPAKA